MKFPKPNTVVYSYEESWVCDQLQKPLKKDSIDKPSASNDGRMSDG